MTAKLPVLDLDPAFSLWDLYTTNDLKDFWNGNRKRNLEDNSEMGRFLYMIDQHNLELYLKEAEDDLMCILLEKSKRYDEIVAWLDAPESTSVILDMIIEVTEEPF